MKHFYNTFVDITRWIWVKNGNAQAVFVCRFSARIVKMFYIFSFFFFLIICAIIMCKVDVADFLHGFKFIWLKCKFKQTNEILLFLTRLLPRICQIYHFDIGILYDKNVVTTFIKFPISSYLFFFFASLSLFLFPSVFLFLWCCFGSHFFSAMDFQMMFALGYYS